MIGWVISGKVLVGGRVLVGEVEGEEGGERGDAGDGGGGPSTWHCTASSSQQ